MTTRSPQTFEVTPPSSTAALLLVLLVGVLPLTIIGVLAMRQHALTHVLPALVILPIMLVLMMRWMKRRSVTLTSATLEVRAAMYKKCVAVAELDLEKARIVNLHERTELRPWLKTNGMSTPGFDAGHFRLREHFGKAFCLLTDRTRVLWLPLRDGKSQLLLSLERPQALLDALRASQP
jgi:hypothetical protein